MNILNYLYSTFDSDINYNDEELNYLNPVVMIKYIYNKPVEFFLFGLALFIIFLVDFITQKNALIFGITQIPGVTQNNISTTPKINIISKKNKKQQINK